MTQGEDVTDEKGMRGDGAALAILSPEDGAVMFAIAGDTIDNGTGYEELPVPAESRARITSCQRRNRRVVAAVPSWASARQASLGGKGAGHRTPGTTMPETTVTVRDQAAG